MKIRLKSNRWFKDLSQVNTMPLGENPVLVKFRFYNPCFSGLSLTYKPNSRIFPRKAASLYYKY